MCKSISSIFKTIKDEIGKFKEAGSFVNWINKSDIDLSVIDNYNAVITDAIDKQATLKQFTEGTNKATADLIKSANGTVISEQAKAAAIKSSTVAAKASTVAMKALGVAANMAFSIGISLAISALISGITKLVQAKEKARQAAIETINVYKDEKAVIEDQTKKYKELAEAIESGNLSTDEIVQKKEELLSIQNDLVDTFGDEAEGIDLVNGKYKEQLGLLENLSKERANNLVAENKDEFEDAKKKLQKERIYNLGKIASWNQNDADAKDNEKLIDYLISYSDLFKVYDSSTSYTTKKYNLKIEANVEDADKVLHDFAQDLRNFGNENGIDVSDILSSVGEQLNDVWTDELTDYKQIYDEYTTGLIMSDDTLRSKYSDAIDAVEKYNKAIASGEGFEEAKSNLAGVITGVESLTATMQDGEDIWRIFQEIFSNTEKTREEVAFDYKKKFGLNYNDKTLETFFKNENVDMERFERIAAVTDNVVEAIRMYHEEIEKVKEDGSIISEEALEKAKSYQSDLKELYEALALLRSGEATPAVINDLIQKFPTLSEHMDDLEGGIKSLIEDRLEDLRKAFDGAINEDALRRLAEYSVKQEAIANSVKNTTSALKNMTSAYKDVADAMKQYNESGFISLELLESIMAMKPEYLGALMDEWNNMNNATDAYKAYVKVRLAEYEADAWAQSNTDRREALAQYHIDGNRTKYDEAVETSMDALAAKLKFVQGIRDNLDEWTKSATSTYSSPLDNILKDFDNQLSHYKNEARYIEAQLSNAEARGYIANEAYYKALENVEYKNYEMLEEKLSSLNNLMATSNYEKNSDEWHKLQNEIEETTIAMQESLNTLVDLDNKIRQVDWDMFDFSRDRESKFMEEADFLIELMDKAEKFNDDMDSANILDNMTSEGMATMGLHAANYNAYLEQSIEYSKELAELQEQINSDKGDTELLSRYDEILEKQQEMILASESEKEAMISLVEEGVELQKEAFQDLIDQYTEALDVQKDLYDYQKKNSEQTKRIAQIQKQISAYSGSQDEEARAKFQKLQVELNDAQSDLESDQYSRYLDDQKEILNSIYEDYEKSLDSYLDDTAKVISDSINKVNNSTTAINGTIKSECDDVGYEISDEMRTVWEDEKKVLSNEFDGVEKNIEANNGVLSGFTESTSEIFSSMGLDIKSIDGTLISIANKMDSLGSSGGSNGEGSQDPTPQPTGVSFKKKTSTYNKDNLNKDTSVVDFLKYYNIDSSKSARADYYSQMGFDDVYNDTSKQNIAMLKWLRENEDKIKGFASGGFNLKKQLAWTQENGNAEYIIRPSDGAILTPLAQGDSVLTSEASKNLWNMANNPMEFIKDNLTVSLPNVAMNSTGGSVENNIHMSLNLPGVSNYQEFVTQLQYDKKFEKMIVDVTSSALTGSNSLSKYRHKF